MNEKLQELLGYVQHTACQAGDLAADVAYLASKQAGQIAASAKRRLKRFDLNTEINVQMRELGELIYATHVGNPTSSEALLEKMKGIDALKSQLCALTQEEKKPAEKILTVANPSSADISEQEFFCPEYEADLQAE